MRRILFVLAARISLVLAALLSYISYELSALTELSVDLLALESGLVAVIFLITAIIFSDSSNEEWKTSRVYRVAHRRG